MACDRDVEDSELRRMARSCPRHGPRAPKRIVDTVVGVRFVLCADRDCETILLRLEAVAAG